MKDFIDFLKRHAVWIMTGLIAFWLVSPAITELRTIFLIIAVESIAIALSGISAYVYTKIDFTREATSNPGLIFLGVHICVGLVVLGVYIVQFSA